MPLRGKHGAGEAVAVILLLCIRIIGLHGPPAPPLKERTMQTNRGRGLANNMSQISLTNVDKTANRKARDEYTEKKLQKACDASGLHAAHIGKNIMVADKRYWRLVRV